MILICKMCGKHFEVSHKNRKHCSMECYANSQRGVRPMDRDGNLVGFTSETAKKYGFKRGNKYGFKRGYTPWNKGKNFTARDIKGKTWEELYGEEKATKMRTGRSNEYNPNWKGGSAGNHSLHTWVRTRLGTPRKCEFCGTEEAKYFDWANKDHKYRRVLSDYMRLCRRCHRQYDIKFNNYRKNGSALTGVFLGQNYDSKTKEV